MKQNILLLVAVLFLGLFTACEKEDAVSSNLISEIVTADKTEIAVSTLPADVIDFVDSHYFDTFIESAYVASDLGYELKMDDEGQAFFATDGEFLGTEEGAFSKGGRRGGSRGGLGCGESVAVEDLPDAIRAYVTTNYADATIKKSKLKDDQYYVGLDNELILVFDQEGNFLEETTFMHGPKGHFGEAVAIEDLPSGVADYVATNYPDGTIAHAKLFEEQYYVGVKSETSKTILIFDANGNFIEERAATHGGHGGNYLAVEDLPAAITDYVTANYAGAEIVKAKLKKDGEYAVFLMNDTTKILLVFDSEGNFLYERMK